MAGNMYYKFIFKCYLIIQYQHITLQVVFKLLKCNIETETKTFLSLKILKFFNKQID